VARQHEAAVLAVHRGELLAPHLEHAAGIRDGVGGSVHVTEEGRVVEQPLHRHLDQRALARLDLVGHVVAHQRGIVEEAVALQEIGGPHVDVPRGRAVARRAHAQARLQDVELLAHHPLLLGLVEEAERLVHVAVGADLVARVADARGLGRMVLDRPARDVEAGAELQPVEQAQDAVDPDAGAEAPLLEIAEAPPGLLGLAEEEAGLGVEVEGQDCGGLLAVGPAVAHRDLLG